MDYYEYVYTMEEGMMGVFGALYVIYYLLTIVLAIVGYVLHSLGVYTIAKRRGIDHPWMAWVPLLNIWILGSISDQFRYVTKGQIRNKRKVLVILMAVLYALMIVLLVAVGVQIVNTMPAMMGDSEEAMVAEALSLVLWMLLGVLGIGGVAIAYNIIYYMVMYDVYTSVNPTYSVVFLVLSIFFYFLEPWFIFFNRKKDLGMPPRCDIPVQPIRPQLPPQEPWENVTEE